MPVILPTSTAADINSSMGLSYRELVSLFRRQFNCDHGWVPHAANYVPGILRDACTHWLANKLVPAH